MLKQLAEEFFEQITEDIIDAQEAMRRMDNIPRGFFDIHIYEEGYEDRYPYARMLGLMVGEEHFDPDSVESVFHFRDIELVMEFTQCPNPQKGKRKVIVRENHPGSGLILIPYITDTLSRHFGAQTIVTRADEEYLEEFRVFLRG